MRPGPIPEEYIMIIIRELLKGLDYLHRDQKLHRDVKGAVLNRTIALSSQTDSCCSCKHPLDCERPGQAGRLWSLRAIVSDDDQEKHVRRHPLLDGTGGY